jgi:hypothetical protein
MQETRGGEMCTACQQPGTKDQALYQALPWFPLKQADSADTLLLKMLSYPPSSFLKGRIRMLSVPYLLRRCLGQVLPQQQRSPYRRPP